MNLSGGEPIILNLGCGRRTSPKCYNIDWSLYLRLRRNPVLRAMAWLFMDSRQRANLRALDGEVLVHDMRRPLPFEAGTVDAVYHSHMMEHIDRSQVLDFQRELLRVLKPGGIQRFAVPDLHELVQAYLTSYAACDADPSMTAHHDATVDALLEQSVRREAAASRTQSRLRKSVEARLLGDARGRGETHQWMYDRFNAEQLLRDAGFVDIQVRSYNDSAIPLWREIGLEVGPDGKEYKSGSLYIEARKPQ